MRLAIIVTEYPKTTETFILRDIMTFLDEGHDVRIYHVAPYREDEILHDFALPTKEIATHIPIASGQSIKAALQRPGFAAARAIQILRHQGAEPLLALKSLAILPQACALAAELEEWQADHIHAEFAGHPATAAWISGGLTKIPYSVSCRAHDIFRTQRLLAQKFSDAAFVRTVSDFGKDFLLEKVKGLSKEKLKVIHSSVDVENIPPLARPANDPFHIVYVGSLQERKGVDVLLQSFQGLSVPSWQCSIAGDGPLRSELENLAKSLGLADRVKFLGKMDFRSVTALYESASVVAAPSVIGPNGRTEGIPNVMIEALAMQRPSISTDLSGIPELIRDRDTGRLIAPNDADALRTALEDIWNDPNEAYAMACRGRKHVEDQFSLRQNAMRQLSLFEKAMTSRQEDHK